MLVNVYCESKGWLFDDLKALIAEKGATPSDLPIPDADAYICIRSSEADLSPKPFKTVVQIHDVVTEPLKGFGMISFVHHVQDEMWFEKGFNDPSIVIPIGTREVACKKLPKKPTIGYFCREVDGMLKRSTMFAEAVEIAKHKGLKFDVLMIGERLEHISFLGKYIKRAATVKDYAKIDALVTTSQSPMIPLSAFEALQSGRAVITTPREWNFPAWGVLEGETPEQIASQIKKVVEDRQIYYNDVPFKRSDWAEKQILLAERLVNDYNN